MPPEIKEEVDLKDLLKDEYNVVGLWSEIWYVTGDNINTKRYCFLDANQTDFLVTCLKLREMIKDDWE